MDREVLRKKLDEISSKYGRRVRKKVGLLVVKGWSIDKAVEEALK
jgi:hypothetical protein